MNFLDLGICLQAQRIKAGAKAADSPVNLQSNFSLNYKSVHGKWTDFYPRLFQVHKQLRVLEQIRSEIFMFNSG